MHIHKLTSLVLVLLTLVSTPAMTSSLIPRKSPELTIRVPSGKQMLLSSLKGKVVVLEFFFVQSDHCTRVARTLNGLGSELGGRGFQPIGIVFDPPNMRTSSEGRLVPAMVNYFKITYPVGYASKSEVDTYLGRTGKEILGIPQVVVIDRAGNIRAASGGPAGDPRLEDENFLRTLINGLLKEGVPAGPVRK